MYNLLFFKDKNVDKIEKKISQNTITYRIFKINKKYKRTAFI